MNFGTVGIWGPFFALLFWAVPFVVLVWFVWTLTAIARSLRDIANRLHELERAVRDALRGAPFDER